MSDNPKPPCPRCGYCGFIEDADMSLAGVCPECNGAAGACHIDHTNYKNMDTNEENNDGSGSEYLEEEEMLKMDGYNDCIVGTVERFGQPTIYCYDKDKVLAKLMADGMDEEEAEEFFYFNQVGAWVGETTPCFITLDPTLAEG